MVDHIKQMLGTREVQGMDLPTQPFAKFNAVNNSTRYPANNC